MRLFISYSRVDKPTCNQIVDLLDAHEVWFDHRIKAGEDWWIRIVQQLEWCEGFIYLLSPESVESKYCNQECEIAIKQSKMIIPVVIRSRTTVPDYLSHIHYVDLSTGITNNVRGVVDLLNALLDAERSFHEQKLIQTNNSLTDKDLTPPAIDDAGSNPDPLDNLPYNYVYRLDQRTSKQHTKKAYYRWVCVYLEDVAGIDPISPRERKKFLSSVPRRLLKENLNPSQLRGWLGVLKAKGLAKVTQPRSAIVTLSDMLAEDGVVDETLPHRLRALNVSVPDSDNGSQNLLDEDEIRMLLTYLDSQPKDYLFVRNATIVTLAFVLRSSAIANSRWSNFQFTDKRVFYVDQNSKPKSLPRNAHKYLQLWKEAILNSQIQATIDSDSYVLRNFSSTGKILETPLSNYTVPDVVASVAKNAGISGHINADRLRLSVRKIGKEFDVSEMF